CPSAVLELRLAACRDQRASRPCRRALQEVVERLAALRLEGLLGNREAIHAVEAEGPEVGAKLAPCRHHPDRPEEGERERTDSALGPLAQHVRVAEADLEAAPDGAPEFRE